MGKAPTVYDIAKELNISVSTVSRALNNSVLVGEETRTAVRHTAKKIGYHPKTVKKHRRRAILNILLLIPYREESRLHMFYDPADLISGIKAGIGETRINLITELADTAGASLGHKKFGDVDAVVCAFMTPPPGVSNIANRRGIPLVSLNRTGKVFDYVSCDNAGGMAALVDRVIGSGRRFTPCFLLPASVPQYVAGERTQGFMRGCLKNGIEAEDLVITVPGLSQITGEFADRLLSGGTRAVMCFNDITAMTFLHAAAQAGAQAPLDYILTGFDNSPIQEVLQRRIDTMDLSVRELGEAAGKWIACRVIEREETRLKALLPARYMPGETIT